MRRLAAFPRSAGEGFSEPKAHPQPAGRAARDSAPAPASYAVVRLTRTLLYDDHPSAGGGPSEIRHDTTRVLMHYEGRVDEAQPTIHTYTVSIAVPSDRPSSWELALGDDYRLLVVTEQFSLSDQGVTIEGRVKSNYQTQLDPSSALIGPNTIHLGFLLRIGEASAASVLDDEVAGRIFREYQEIEVEAVVGSPPESSVAGIEESAEAQQRRWNEWTSIRKSSLR
jgi:hypothetical protein